MGEEDIRTDLSLCMWWEWDMGNVSHRALIMMEWDGLDGGKWRVLMCGGGWGGGGGGGGGVGCL